ncbi:MAG TPA: LUD domain-containing protein [Segetibacter sp.]|jgi:L-lactate dehydrogenase complex protein LldG
MKASNTTGVTGTSVSSRDKILASVQKNQPVSVELPPIINHDQRYPDVVEKYMEVLRFIGGDVHLVNDFAEIESIVRGAFQHEKRMVSTCVEFAGLAEVDLVVNDPHEVGNVDLFITTSRLAVAENGSVWLQGEQILARVLPFITQQLAVIVKKENIVSTMHDAYNVIGNIDYSYAAFIAGPSKTADIEQSLVLGAHGAKTMTVFILK